MEKCLWNCFKPRKNNNNEVNAEKLYFLTKVAHVCKINVRHAIILLDDQLPGALSRDEICCEMSKQGDWKILLRSLTFIAFTPNSDFHPKLLFNISSCSSSRNINGDGVLHKPTHSSGWGGFRMKTRKRELELEKHANSILKARVGWMAILCWRWWRKSKEGHSKESSLAHSVAMFNVPRSLNYCTTVPWNIH